MKNLDIQSAFTKRTEVIEKYFKDISSYPKLSVKEETELLNAISLKNEDSTAAFEKMINSNLRFVVSVANTYKIKNVTLEDLISEGNKGLIIALRKFDSALGFKFITYAVWWIRKAMLCFIDDHAKIVRLPLNKLSQINKIKRVVNNLESELGYEPTIYQIGEVLEYQPEEVSYMLSLNKNYLSLNTPISSEDTSNDEHIDFLTSSSEDLYEKVDQDRALAQILETRLSRREFSVVKQFFGLFDTPVRSVVELSIAMDLTGSTIRLILKTAFKKLRTGAGSAAIKNHFY